MSQRAQDEPGFNIRFVAPLTPGGRGGAHRSMINCRKELEHLGVSATSVDCTSNVLIARHLLGLIVTDMATLWRRRDRQVYVWNGLESLLKGTPMNWLLAAYCRATRGASYMYWHEMDGVIRGARRNQPIHCWVGLRLLSALRTRHLVASQATGESVQRHLPGAQYSTIYETIDIPAPFDSPCSPASPPMVVNVASVRERKGADLFLETAELACDMHATVRFVFLGGGPELAAYQRKASESRHCGRIFFPGYMEGSALLLNLAHVFFLSSREDPCPLAMLEAMSLGRWIVAFRSGGASEVLRDCGVLVDGFSPTKAAGVILGLISEDSPELDLRAREAYMAEFAPRKFCLRLLEAVGWRGKHNWDRET